LIHQITLFIFGICCTEDMDIASDSEEAANYHQILEFFEMCANLITTLARWWWCWAAVLDGTCWWL